MTPAAISGQAGGAPSTPTGITGLASPDNRGGKPTDVKTEEANGNQGSKRMRSAGMTSNYAPKRRKADADDVKEEPAEDQPDMKVKLGMSFADWQGLRAKQALVHEASLTSESVAVKAPVEETS